MAAPDGVHEYPLIARLIDRMKRLSGRLAGLSELRSLEERHVDQIAHEFGLSRSGLFSLCANEASGDLLKQRLAEFGLTERQLARQHPEVLQDLQRVCGTCMTTSRCASDFVAQRDSGRDGYCPNTCTLYALKQEGLARGNSGSCCGSCGS
jgi:hypothetical protein